ncbi:hypothetical protein OFAG_02337 [Oxalobacter formigenes HOxBLS]|uniref:Uncharacterized protein n=1 Tax=Oxalobacter paraformigenes TaxID=556268 RepID=T5LUE8_9BURK|nr:hypothetical protein OFAG_02337 [Oxalobacter paraformigenes]
MSLIEQTKLNRLPMLWLSNRYKPLHEALMAAYLSGKVWNPEQWEPKKEADSPVDGRIDMSPVGAEAIVPGSQDMSAMIQEDTGGFSSEWLRDTADDCFECFPRNEERLKASATNSGWFGNSWAADIFSRFSNRSKANRKQSVSLTRP